MPQIARQKRSQRPFRSLDLFAGAGGFSEGFRQAGFQTIAATDADYTLAQATMKRYQLLFDKKSVSPQEYDEVKTRLAAAKAESVGGCRPLGRTRPRCRSVLHRLPSIFNRNVNNLHRPKRTIVARVCRHARNLLHQFHRGVITLSEDRVTAIQMRRGDFGNKKLRAVRTGSGVRVSQATRLVEG